MVRGSVAGACHALLFLLVACGSSTASRGAVSTVAAPDAPAESESARVVAESVAEVATEPTVPAEPEPGVLDTEVFDPEAVYPTAIQATVGTPPEPPHQNDPWSPAAEIPAELAEAARTLRGLGLPSPEGCEARRLRVAAAQSYAGRNRSPIETLAWALPGNEFAIGMNGLVVPIVELGEAVDLAVALPPMLDGPYGHTEPSLLALVLLTLAGEGALVAQLTSSMPAASADDPPLAARAGGEWLGGLLFEMLAAYARADDAFAGAIGSAFDEAAPEVSRLLPDDWRRRSIEAMRGLVTELSTELRQRRRARPATGDDPARELAEAARGIDLGFSASVPTVDAIASRGEEVAPALIRALRRDRRASRVVLDAYSGGSIGLHPTAMPRVVSVAELAWWVLRDALHARDLEPVGSLAAAAERRALADRVQTFHDRWHGVPLERRWLTILADDAATTREWVTVADHIACPSDVTVHAGECLGGGTFSIADGRRGALRGEVLRGETDPSVEELLARRLVSVAGGDEPWEGCILAGALVAWGPGAHADALATFVTSCTSFQICSCVIDISAARRAAGDPSAIVDLVAWLDRIDRTALEPHMLDPLADAGDDATARAYLERLFPAGDDWVDDAWGLWFESPLWRRIPAMRAVATRALADRTSIGTVSLEADTIRYETSGGGSGLRSAPDGTPDFASRPFRRSDRWALELSSHDGAPPFDLSAAEAERDAAARAIAAWLAR